MCIGVSVSNSVLLSTFMEADWRKGMSLERAAVKAAKDRLRPILMTAIAMLLGTLPMALALEKGSEMTAPLGWAVIGGLVVSTFATLLVVPALFTLLMRGAKRMPPSLDPDDPASLYYDGGEPAAMTLATTGRVSPHGPVASHGRTLPHGHTPPREQGQPREAPLTDAEFLLHEHALSQAPAQAEPDTHLPPPTS
jgi:AcrB/AcrD/AcrF family